MSNSSKRIGEGIAIGVGVTVGSALAIGVIGSLVTANPAPLLAALKIGAAVGGVGAVGGGNS